jgi:hypothetical protein
MSLSMGAFGFCVDCGTIHVLPTTPDAKRAALQLLDLLNETGRVDFMRGNNTPDVIDSRGSVLPFMDPATFMNSQGEEAAKLKGDASVVFPTTLLTEQRGKMMGVMVCEFGNETIALCAFAGAIGGSYHVPGWVPPIGKFSEEWEETQNLVSKISNQMNAIQQQSEHVMIENENENEREPSIETEWNRLREERARISSKSLAILRSHQLVSNFKSLENNGVPECKTLEEIYMETMAERR